MSRHQLARLASRLVGLLICLWLLVSSNTVLAQWEDSILNFSQPALTQTVGDTEEVVETGCVWLDGYCAFRVAGLQSDLNDRIRAIETALIRIRDIIRTTDSLPEIDVRYEELEAPDSPTEADETSESEASPEATLKSPSLHFIGTPEQPIRLMSVNKFDAELKGVDGPTAAEDYKKQVEAALLLSRQEHSLPFLAPQIGISLAIINEGKPPALLGDSSSLTVPGL